MTPPLQKILYVEDDQSIAEITMMILEDIGEFEVVHCSSGKLALEHLKNDLPQIILLDVMMPEMDGIETLSHIKNNPKTASIPVIFVTAKTQEHEQKNYLSMGAIAVIKKPFNPETFCQEIEDIWKKYYDNTQ